MESNDNDFSGNRMDQSVINISAKIADAVEMVQRLKEITDKSKDMLIKVQMELEELFLSIDN